MLIHKVPAMYASVKKVRLSLNYFVTPSKEDTLPRKIILFLKYLSPISQFGYDSKGNDLHCHEKEMLSNDSGTHSGGDSDPRKVTSTSCLQKWFPFAKWRIKLADVIIYLETFKQTCMKTHSYLLGLLKQAHIYQKIPEKIKKEHACFLSANKSKPHNIYIYCQLPSINLFRPTWLRSLIKTNWSRGIISSDHRLISHFDSAL